MLEENLRQLLAGLPAKSALPWGTETEAVRWSQRKGDRSGRIAYQFACDWVGRQLLARAAR